MRAHRGRQHLRRKRHKVGVDRARKNDRKLGQTGNLIEQRRVRLKGVPLGGCGLFEAPTYHLDTATLVENDMSLSKTIEIVHDAADADFARRQKAMSSGRLPDRDPV